MLLQLNERGRWTNPPPEDPQARALQDEEIFQTARLVKYVSRPHRRTIQSADMLVLQLRQLHGDDLW